MVLVADVIDPIMIGVEVAPLGDPPSTTTARVSSEVRNPPR
jgi:hypothetical protein